MSAIQNTNRSKEKLMNNLIKYLLIAAMITFTTSIANAAYLDYIDTTDKLAVHLKFNEDADDTTPLSGWEYFPGRIGIELTGYSNVAFCIELGPTTISKDGIEINSPGSYWSSYGNNGLYAAYLMDRYNPEFGYESGKPANVAYAALQLAIWDTIYDFNFNGSSSSYIDENFISALVAWPDLTLSDDEKAAWALAEEYTDSLTEALSHDSNILNHFSGKYKYFVADFGSNYVHGKDGDEGQELLIAMPVPEPTTMLLFGIGLLGISAIGRRKT